MKPTPPEAQSGRSGIDTAAQAHMPRLPAPEQQPLLALDAAAALLARHAVPTAPSPEPRYAYIDTDPILLPPWHPDSPHYAGP